MNKKIMAVGSLTNEAIGTDRSHLPHWICRTTPAEALKIAAELGLLEKNPFDPAVDMDRIAILKNKLGAYLQLPTLDRQRPLEDGPEVLAFGTQTKQLPRRLSYLEPFAEGSQGEMLRVSQQETCKRSWEPSIPEMLIQIDLQRAGLHVPPISFVGVLRETESTKGIALAFMDLVPGKDVFEVIQSAKGLLPATINPFVAILLTDMVPILQHLHARGVLYRDIKPENILCEKGEKIRFFGIDFGVATCKGEQAEALGTLEYMAPEVLGRLLKDKGLEPSGPDFKLLASFRKSDPKVAEPSDVYALGLALCYVINSTPRQYQKYDLSTESKINSSIKNAYLVAIKGSYKEPKPWSSLDTLIASMIDPDPAKRPTLQQILTHPFMRENPVNDTLRKSTLRNIATYF